MANPITYKRDVKHRHDMHKRRLRSMKPSVDNSAPKSFGMPHMRRNPKKAQLQEERFSRIERENRILLEKMSHIMQHQVSGVGTAPWRPARAR